MAFVLKPWVSDAPLKCQSILCSGLRAPDQKTDAVKKCIRWLRGQCQLDADPAKQSYMQSIEMTHELADAAMAELEYCPVHFAHHFADAFAVTAYYHPVPKVQDMAYYVHYQVAEELFHFRPETRKMFLERHKDRGGPDSDRPPRVRAYNPEPDWKE